MKGAWSFLAAAVASLSLGWAPDQAKTTLKIEGMTCGGCVAAVKVQLKRTEGVTAYEVSLEKGEAEVSYDPTRTAPEKIAESVSATGFKASVKKAADDKDASDSKTSAPSAPEGMKCGASCARDAART